RGWLRPRLPRAVPQLAVHLHTEAVRLRGRRRLRSGRPKPGRRVGVLIPNPGTARRLTGRRRVTRVARKGGGLQGEPWFPLQEDAAGRAGSAGPDEVFTGAPQRRPPGGGGGRGTPGSLSMCGGGGWGRPAG